MSWKYKRPKMYFWEEAAGVQSSIRVQMILSMFFTFYIIDWMVQNDKIDITVIVLLLLASFTPKVLSKISEVRSLAKDGRKPTE